MKKLTLTDKQIARLTDDGKTKRMATSERGLYLALFWDRTDGHQWRFDYYRPLPGGLKGKKNTMVIGHAKFMERDTAITKAKELNKLIANGTDPVAVRQADESAKALAIAAEAAAKKRKAEDLAPAGTLLGVCQDFKNGKLASGDWKDEFANSWISLVKRCLPDGVALMPIEDVKPLHILEQVIRPLEKAGKDATSKTVRKFLAQVFDYAEVMEIRQGNPSRVLKSQVKQHAVPGVNPAATEPAQLKLVLEKILRLPNPVIRAALQVQAAIWQRPGETVSMKWADVDLKAGLWNEPIVPRTKLAKSLKHVKGGVHVVPLPRQVVTLLEALKAFTGHSEYVFLSPANTGKPVDSDSLSKALLHAGLEGIQTPHGFRATGRTMVVEQLHLSAQVAECQLAHSAGIEKADGSVVKDTLRGAYDRATMLPQRIEMIQAWADYLDQLLAEEVPAQIEAQPLKLAA